METATMMPTSPATSPTSTPLPSPLGDDSGVTPTNSTVAGPEDEFVSQEQDELMSEMILKHRTELQKFVERTMPLVADDGKTPRGMPPAPFAASDEENLQNIPPQDVDGQVPRFRTPQPTRSKAGERLMQLSRTERTDRMRLAELSDVRNEKLGRAAILKWNPHAKLTRERDNRTFIGDVGLSPHGARARCNTSPPRTTARMLGEVSKDYVQQALDFNNPNLLGDDDSDQRRRCVDDDDQDDEEDDEDDDMELPPPSPSSLHEFLERQPKSKRSTKAVKKYVKHMELTIAQLVQQKDELLRNQAEFDKHASGMFPTLETLNNQLSQIVHDRMLQSQANIKDDLESELRLLRGRLNELDLEAKQRRHDADLLDQKRQIDIAQIKGDIASLGTTGTLQNQKLELMTSQVKKLQQDLHKSVQVLQSVTQQSQSIEKKLFHVQASSIPHSMKGHNLGATIVAISIVILSLVIAVVVSDTCSIFDQCYPLT